MQYSDNSDQHKADAKAVFDHAKSTGNVAGSGTEAGGNSGNLPAQLKSQADSHNLWLFIHDSGEWVWFDKAWGSHVDHGWIKVIPARGGTYGHNARGVCWFTAKPKGSGPQLSLAVVHYLTQNSLDHEPDPNANKKLAQAAVNWAKDKASGSGVVLLNGDVNMPDKSKDVWWNSDIVTCWDELKKWPDTHEGGPANSIDVISRYKPDGTKFTKANALADSDLKLYTDHLLIQATLSY